MDNSLTTYATTHTTTEPELLLQLIGSTHARMLYPQMLTSRTEGRLLKMLVQMVQARYVLEIGTFTGYSALSMAEGLPDHGKLITCENNDEAATMARKFFEMSPYGHKIQLVFGDAAETIPRLAPGFDLAFLDADKRSYLRHYELIIPLLRPGGVLAVDNALWYGKVVNENKDQDTAAIDLLNRRIIEDERVENVLLTIGDGVNLVRKKESA